MIKRIVILLLLVPVTVLAQKEELSGSYEEILEKSLKIQLKIDSLQTQLESKYKNFDAENEVVRNEIAELKRAIFFLQEEANSGYKKAREIEKLELDNYYFEKARMDSIGAVHLDSIRNIQPNNELINLLDQHSILKSRHYKRLKDLIGLEKGMVETGNSDDFFQLNKRETKILSRNMQATERLFSEKYQIYSSYIHFAREKCKKSVCLDEGRNLEIRAKQGYNKSKILENRITNKSSNEYLLQKRRKINELIGESLKLLEKAYYIYLDESQVCIPRVKKKVEMPAIFYNEFMVLPGSIYSDANPIPINNSVPGGIIFKIQLGVFRNPMPQDKFYGISPIVGEQVKDMDALRYYAGIFSNFADAEKALIDVHSEGFQDAYIIAFQDGKKISVERAKQYLKNNEHRKVLEIKDQVTNSDNIYQGIIYKIQIGVYEEGIPLYVINILKNNIENKKITHYKNKNGQIVYSIEKFNNFGDAQKMRNLLVENDLLDIFIIAFKREQRIQLKEAIKLEEEFTK